MAWATTTLLLAGRLEQVSDPLVREIVALRYANGLSSARIAAFTSEVDEAARSLDRYQRLSLDGRFGWQGHIDQAQEILDARRAALQTSLAAVRKCHPHERYLLDDGRGRLAYTSPGAFAPQLQRDRAALGLNGRGVKLVHGFRALYAHRLRERGAPLDASKNLLGHSDIKVTEGYFPASQTRERAAVALLDGPRHRGQFEAGRS
jgi:hypothetical protein